MLDLLKRLIARPDGISAPELDDPDHVEGEPELTDDDLAGRLEEAEPITSHVNLQDDA